MRSSFFFLSSSSLWDASQALLSLPSSSAKVFLNSASLVDSRALASASSASEAYRDAFCSLGGLWPKRDPAFLKGSSFRLRPGTESRDESF